MTDNSVKALVVDGITLPMHSTYAFELQKVYIEDPQRTNSGTIPIFPDKFFVPYFTVTWAVLKIEDYKKIMQLIEKDENVVEYYDQTDNSYKTAKFYAQQPTYNKLYSIEKRYNMVLGLQIVFAGTLNDVGEVIVEYNANGGSGAVTSQRGISGEEFVVNAGSTISRVNYVLSSWNTREDGLGDIYSLGEVRAFTSSIVLYAQWVASEGYTLSLAYGVGAKAKDKEGNDITSISVKKDVAIEGLPANVIVKNSVGDEFKDLEGNVVYSFQGWNKLSQDVGVGTFINNGDTYDVAGNSTIYAHFTIKEYTLQFNTNGGGDIQSITAPYKSTISLPTPVKAGYKFIGWYTDEDFTTSFSLNYMPYQNLTLYAKYEVVEYTITFNKNGGTGGTNSVATTYNTVVPDIQIPTQSGYTFVGYFTQLIGGIKYYDENGHGIVPYPYVGNLTLYAQWTEA